MSRPTTKPAPPGTRTTDTFRLPYPEGPPLFSIVAASAVSFGFLVLLPYLAFPAIISLTSDGAEPGPAVLLASMNHLLLDALLGAIVLGIAGYSALLVCRRFRLPRWTPCAVAFPACWLLLLPSWLEHGGTWYAWLFTMSLPAVAFCVHWWAFAWARGIWD